MPSSTEHAPLGLRLVKVPDAAPPYDCELHGTACPATREVHRGEFAGLGEAGVPGASAVPGVAGVAVSSVVSGVAGVAAGEPVAASGVDAAWPRQFAQVIVEVLAGSRSRRQIIPWTADRVQAQIRLLAPILACDQQARVRRVVTSRPTARVVEMTVIVSFGPRSRALAMRLEHNPARPAAPGLAARPARWICTELESG